MSVLMFLIILSLLCSTLGLLSFIWAVSTGQFDQITAGAKCPFTQQEPGEMS
ncbi:MAG: cbb3-type cytochrome oxidase assembly protein CcoS [Deltaproteobacteria bacterium]|nr:cbb3-type cytochrome oxidase assembly protein CcoS [Deltaproteobacteria bacterium]